MATYNLALILGNPLNNAEFLLAKQTPPPKFGIEEYDSFVDSDLWDLPSKKLDLVEGELEPGSFVIEGLERTSLRKFDFDSAINKVLEQVGFKANDGGEWRFLKHLEEAEFGPGLPVHTVYISGKLLNRNRNLPGLCKWMSIQSCLSWLVDVKPSSDRVGPLVVLGLINDSVHSSEKVSTALDYQEYPPGVIIVPMRSRTAKPFHTTNLVVFAPESVNNKCEDYNFVAHGDALIVDPGCRANFHKELLKVVAPLSKKLVVFVTHHHRDHVDGLSVIQKCNPNATLLAHKNSMRCIGKGDWSLNHISVSGGEDICIGGQRLNIIFAPDYFQSTYKFIELAPHVLIPMHGRVNLWPKRMLCGYLKNRRSRELSILEAIENGAKTLIDIVANIYSEVDRSLWLPASSNVRLHVEHLAQQNKLPKEFSIQKFQRTCGVHFISRWIWAYLAAEFLSRSKNLHIPKILIGGAVVSFAVFYSLKYKLS
ncbi:hypothetical protein NC652_027041 [Populus alba x Populus x berolinensis]|nr:hypothetical protein NC652_027041 [Populus alba x Populus x berolinensis]